jgi:hypothetical protein
MTLTYNSSIPSTAAPVPRYYPNGLPASFTLPPQSLALFETYNSPAYPVEFTESGLTLGWTSTTPHWFLDVNGTHTASNSTNLTLLLLPGDYSTSGTPLPLPANGTDPKERREPFAPATVTVGAALLGVRVPYNLQWAINVTWNDTYGSVVSGGGSEPPPSWWNASQPLILNAAPRTGYAFNGWSGEGSGSFGGYNFTATLLPTGPIDEQAIFLANVSTIVFAEQGLTTGTPWFVTLRGLDVPTTQSMVTFSEINGNWSYQVPNITGYHLDQNVSGFGSVHVTGTGTIVVPVIYDRFYSVSFQETGLAPGTAWSLGVLGVNGSAWINSSASAKTFFEINGTWGYAAGAAGYHVNESLNYGSIYVNGPNLVVQVTFEKIYSVTFEQNGLPTGTNWSLEVTGVNGSFWSNSSSNSKVFYEIFGVWAYQSSSPGYHVNELFNYGSVNVTDTDMVVPVTFEFLYSVVFDESGLAAGTPWNLTVTGVDGPVSINSSAAAKTFFEVDSIYNAHDSPWGYRVGNITGYHLENGPGFGSVNVSNADQSVPIVFDFLYTVVFNEVGLPSGTNWSVEIFGVSGPARNSTSTTAMTFTQPDGSWGFEVGAIPGFYIEGTPGFGFVPVTNSNTTFTIVFEKLYAVAFHETGLPSGVRWDVTTRLGSETLSGSDLAPSSIPLAEVNGSYGFRAYAVGNSTISWRVTSPLYFTVANASETITVTFVPGYLVLWEETGLGKNVTWSVEIHGQTNVSNLSHPGWIHTNYTNGTDPFVITGGQDYVANPRIGNLVVAGSNETIFVHFVRATFAVTFTLSGLPGGDAVSIRLASFNYSDALSSFTFQIPNSTYQDDHYYPHGIYTFSLTSPSGYYASPDGGNVSVNGHTVNIAISILLIGRGPTPPFWTLVLPAAGAASAVAVSGMAMFALLGAIRRLRTGASPRTGAPL